MEQTNDINPNLTNTLRFMSKNYPDSIGVDDPMPIVGAKYYPNGETHRCLLRYKGNNQVVGVIYLNENYEVITENTTTIETIRGRIDELPV